ncbi:hypothetical protein BGZ46_009168 [Entomortierella lignicola]|nr:hypothetical protein BGZ46_009168 [Entomortierella lignicola]
MASTNPPYKRPHDATDVRHELAYIPFSKTSKTFVKKPGNSSNPLSPMENHWGSNSIDDAKVPKFDKGDYESYDPRITQESPVNRKYSIVKDGESLKTISSTPRTSPRTMASASQALRFQSTAITPQNNDTGADLVYYGQQNMEQCLETSERHFIQYQGRIWNVSEVTEVDLGTPPSLRPGSRKQRKALGFNSLNQKYAKMKHDMELLSRDVAIQSNGSNACLAPFSGIFGHIAVNGSSSHPPKPFVSRSQDSNDYGATISQSVTLGTNRDTVQHEAYSNMQHTPRLSPLSVPLEDDLLEDDIKRYETAISPSGSVVGSNSGPRGDVNQYSRPQFQFNASHPCPHDRSDHSMSSVKALHQIPHATSGPNISQEECHYSFDPENTRYEREEFIYNPENGYTIPNYNSDVFECQSGLSMDAMVPLAPDLRNPDKQIGFKPITEIEEQQSTSQLILDNTTVEQEHEQGCLHQAANCSLLDKIHRFGSKMKTSASTTVLSFREKGFLSRDREQDQKKRKLHQMSRFDISVEPSTSLYIQAQPNPQSSKCVAVESSQVTSKNLQGGVARAGNMENSEAAPITVKESNASSDSLDAEAKQSTSAIDSKALSDEGVSIISEICQKDQSTAATLRYIKSSDTDLERISILEQEIQNLTKG